MKLRKRGKSMAAQLFIVSSPSSQARTGDGLSKNHGVDKQHLNAYLRRRPRGPVESRASSGPP